MGQQKIQSAVNIGDKFIVDGTGLHNQDIVEVVCWNDSWNDTRYRNNDKDIYYKKLGKGLIPCYNPRYPTTMVWWFARHQLKKI